MTTPLLPWIDWMKGLGLALIVFGHVSGATRFNHLLPPIYPKQLGVALFLFVAGVALAREVRTAREVLYRRLFEVYLFGLAAALLTSAALAARGAGVAASNYLPFLLGANVALDAFPQNPTTWYIGTYLHFLLIWAVGLRRVPIGAGTVALAAVAEVPLRAAAWQAAGSYVAYMAVPNWTAVFLLGLACGRREEPASPGREETLTTKSTKGTKKESNFIPIFSSLSCFSWLNLWISALPVLVLGAAAVAWTLVASRFNLDRSFPFMRLRTGLPAADLAATSAAVTLVYLLFTALAYEVSRRLPPSAAARFFARNSLLVFIAHMPVFALIRGPIARLRWGFIPASALRFAICFVLLAVLSEVVRRVIRPDRWRDELWRHASRRAPHPGARTSSPA